MKRSLVTLATVAATLFALPLFAQEAPKKPGPDHKKLEMLTGRWKFSEVSVANPFWRAGKVTVQSDVRMILDGFFLEERAKGAGPDGPIAWLSVTGWDDEKKRYQNAFFENSGFFNKAGKNDASLMTVAGKTWTGTWNSEKDGKTYQCRSVNTVSPDGKSCVYKFEYSEDGATWKPWMSGSGKKIRSIR